MTPRTFRIINTAVIAILLLIGFVLMFASCTVVYIEGDENSISDTGGHGGGVALPAHDSGQQTTTLHDRLHGLRQDH